jgi:hypothetical protein
MPNVNCIKPTWPGQQYGRFRFLGAEPEKYDLERTGDIAWFVDASRHHRF